LDRLRFEYLTFNYYNESEGNYTYNWLDEIAGSFDYWTRYDGNADYYNESVSAFDWMNNNFKERVDSGEHPHAALPTVTIPQYTPAQEKNNKSIKKKYPCIIIPILPLVPCKIHLFLILLQLSMIVFASTVSISNSAVPLTWHSLS
jgi:hypothetical protein